MIFQIMVKDNLAEEGHIASLWTVLITGAVNLYGKTVMKKQEAYTHRQTCTPTLAMLS